MNTWADESYKIYFLAKPVKIVAPDAVFADLLRVRSDIKIMLIHRHTQRRLTSAEAYPCTMTDLCVNFIDYVLILF